MRAGPAVAVSSPQSEEFRWGASTTGGLELPFVPQVGIAVELNAAWLADGPAPADETLSDRNAGGAVGGGLALHLRPFASSDPVQRDALSGLWLSLSYGVVSTAGDAKFFSEGVLGWDYLFGDGSFGLGPYAGIYHVFQPDDQLRPENANLLIFGVHAMLDGTPRRPSDLDGDGVLDIHDRCPQQREDLDGYLDADGCPDDDNDGDGVFDVIDHCPNDAEDLDQFEDEDGCPELDNDRDNVPDIADKCPDEPEDHDGYADADGCPDLDNDEDGIKDIEDACPLEPETKNGYADHDGCPDAEQVRVVGDKILLDDRIYFRTNSWIIRKKSYRLLNSLKRLIEEHPEYVHIEVHGHADARGNDKFNDSLSKRRAKAVMDHLTVTGGLDAARFSYKGFGSRQPLADGTGAAALYLNRRVEFKITKQVEQILRRGGPSELPAEGVVGSETQDTKAMEQEGDLPGIGRSFPSLSDDDVSTDDPADDGSSTKEESE